MDKCQAEESIRLIRQIMERSSKCTSFSGISGIVAGSLALAGCAITYWVTVHLPESEQNFWYLAIWISAFVLAVAQDCYFAHKKAQKIGVSYFGPATYQLLKAVWPGVFVAVVVSAVAFSQGALDPIPSVWALGYGAALCAAGMFTVKEVSVFGIVQLLTGAVGLIFFSNFIASLYVLAVSMGVYHILFGLWLTRKYGW